MNGLNAIFIVKDNRAIISSIDVKLDVKLGVSDKGIWLWMF